MKTLDELLDETRPSMFDNKIEDIVIAKLDAILEVLVDIRKNTKKNNFSMEFPKARIVTPVWCPRCKDHHSNGCPEVTPP